MQQTSLSEYIAVLAGMASVWYGKKENILVYPTGLLNTLIYIGLSFKYHLPGEATVNFYYSIMNIYGWFLWTRKKASRQPVLQIRYSTAKERVVQLLFFGTCYITIFFALYYLKRGFAPGAIPGAGALASASAFTAMWLIAKKESRLVDRYKHKRDTIVFYKRTCFYQCILLRSPDPGNWWFNRMEKKSPGNPT